MLFEIQIGLVIIVVIISIIYLHVPIAFNEIVWEITFSNQLKNRVIGFYRNDQLSHNDFYEKSYCFLFLFCFNFCMGNKKTYNIIDGLQKQIDIHLMKIDNEFGKKFPNYGNIHHWQAEINAWEKRIGTLLKRLRR
jgi:hypothetical protein